MDIKEILKLVSQIAKSRGIPEEKVIGVLEDSIEAAWKKEFGAKGQKIEAKIDLKTGKVSLWRILRVVEDEAENFNPKKEIKISQAKSQKEDVKVGDEIKIQLSFPEKFGRIASQTAKQVLLQRMKEVEREIIWEELKAKEGEIVSGIVQKVEPKVVYFDLGRTIGLLPKQEQIPHEFYRVGQRLKAIVIKVEKTSKGPQVILSRSYPKFVSKLFEMEVPEIASGQVEIKSIAREPGSRTKIAVASNQENLDPVGACVGQRGVRVQVVINELGGEKIDIIQYSEDPEEYIKNALSPAKVSEVKILPKNKALAIVDDNQLSLAIGKDGQNVRLAAKLTNWKIDVKSKSQIEKEGLEI